MTQQCQCQLGSLKDTTWLQGYASQERKATRMARFEPARGREFRRSRYRLETTRKLLLGISSRCPLYQFVNLACLICHKAPEPCRGVAVLTIIA